MKSDCPRLTVIFLFNVAFLGKCDIQMWPLETRLHLSKYYRKDIEISILYWSKCRYVEISNFFTFQDFHGLTQLKYALFFLGKNIKERHN